MFRAHIGIATLAAIASLTATTPAAHAADYSPPPIVQPEEYSGWYLRGFVGVGMTTGSTIEYQPDPANVGNGFVFDQHSMGDTAFVGGGFGYEVNHWLRFDGTAEYRTRTQFNARGVYNPITGQGDSYQGYMKSLVFLANAYADLGTWNCFTPFLGAGIGVAYNQVVDFVDMGIGTTGAGFGRNTAEWHLAWAVYAGVAYNVTKKTSRSTSPTAISTSVRQPTPSTASAAAWPIPTSSESCSRTTSCSVCAGRAAKRRRLSGSRYAARASRFCG